MHPRPKPLPVINNHPFPNSGKPIVRPRIPIKPVSGPTVILPPNTLPNTRPVSAPKTILIPTSTPYSNTPNIISTNLPNTKPEDTKAIKDNTMTYVIIGAVVVGFLILKNKDI